WSATARGGASAAAAARAPARPAWTGERAASSSATSTSATTPPSTCCARPELRQRPRGRTHEHLIVAVRVAVRRREAVVAVLVGDDVEQGHLGVRLRP